MSRSRRRGSDSAFLRSLLVTLCYLAAACGDPADAPAGQEASKDPLLFSFGSETCSSVSYDGHAYTICDGSRTWAQAQAQCRAAGSDLARIDHHGEGLFLA